MATDAVDNIKSWSSWLEIKARRHPVALFQAAAFAFHHESWMSWVLLASALLADREFRRIESADRWFSELWKVLRFVKKHASCEYARIDLSAVVGKDVFERYRAQLLVGSQLRREIGLRKFFRTKSINDALRERTRLYVVMKGEAREKPGPSSFMTDLGGFVFVTERPADIVGPQRFYLLHELGHLSQFSKYTARRGRIGASPFFFLFYWALPQLLYPSFGFWTLFALGAFWLAVTFFRDEHWPFVRGFGHVLDEIYADRFACENLEEKDLLAVAKLYRRRPISPDPTVPDDPAIQKMDEFRRRTLSDILSEVYESQGKRRSIPSIPQFTRPDPSVWICFLLAATLAPLANPATCGATVATAFISFTAIGLYCALFYWSRLLERSVLSVLTGSPSIPAKIVQRWPEEPWWAKRLRLFLGYEAAPLSQPAAAVPKVIFVVAILILVAYLGAAPFPAASACS